MIPFLFLLFSLGLGVALYFTGFAMLLVAFVVASPLIFAYLMYKDIKELAQDEDSVEPAEVVTVTTSAPVRAETIAKMSYDREIDTLQTMQVPALLEQLPYDHSHHADFSQSIVDGKWTFRFKLNSPRARFSAGGLGDSPTEAFLIAKQIVHKQIREWHDARAKNIFYDATSNEDLLLKVSAAAHEALRPPMVMIVDDDVDVAMSLDLIFKQLGCSTTIITNPNDLHRKLSMQDNDIIMLDWMLSERLQANQVVEKAVRVIDSFSDLKRKFTHTQPKIITYSVLEKDKILMPENQYFKHLDHWQKPISHFELTHRISELVNA